MTPQSRTELDAERMARALPECPTVKFFLSRVGQPNQAWWDQFAGEIAAAYRAVAAEGTSGTAADELADLCTTPEPASFGAVPDHEPGEEFQITVRGTRCGGWTNGWTTFHGVDCRWRTTHSDPALAKALGDVQERADGYRAKAERDAISSEDWRFTDGYSAALRDFRAALEGPPEGTPE